MPQIVSLIPSATEIVCALGAQEQLVGRSHECDYPPGVQSLPICTSPKFDPHGSSREIDQRVKVLLQDAISVYRVDAQQIQELKPDCILTQAQCEVCAVSLSEVEAMVGEWIGSRPSIISLSSNTLDEVWEDIRRVARGLGCGEKGEALVAGLQRRLAGIEEKTRHLDVRPTVGCIEWLDPLMASGNWMPELIDLAGGQNVFGRAGEHAPWLAWDSLRKEDPDILLLLPCGFSIPRIREEIHLLTRQPEWAELKAVQQGQVFLTDGNQYFNRPGPRLVESVEILTEIFHPTLWDFNHEGKGWERLASSPA